MSEKETCFCFSAQQKPALILATIAASLLNAYVSMLSSNPVAKRVSGTETIPALACPNAEMALAGSHNRLS